MEFAIITISNIIWILYCLFEGMRESIFKFTQDSSRREVNIKINQITNIQRLLVITPISILMFYTIGIYTIPFLIGQMLIFKYFHQLSYSCTYRRLKRKKSKTKIDIENKKMIILGIVFQVLTYLIIN